MKTALIGHTGVIGSVLKDTMQFHRLYNSENISLLSHDVTDSIVCAAPSGNRMYANQNADKDLESIDTVITSIAKASPQRLVLISTVDTINFPNTPYGANRKKLEDFVKQTVPNHHVIRLCSLIGKTITKNPLYDLKHNKFVEKINRNSVIHWYPLQNLHNDIELIVNNKITDINLTSEPIANSEVILKFFPDLYNLTTESAVAHKYDIKTEQFALFNQTVPYAYNKAQIFKYMQDYVT
jgi:hypothetical protein